MKNIDSAFMLAGELVGDMLVEGYRYAVRIGLALMAGSVVGAFFGGAYIMFMVGVRLIQ